MPVRNGLMGKPLVLKTAADGMDVLFGNKKVTDAAVAALGVAQYPKAVYPATCDT